uniref:Choline transporter-like protein n=1 Tax=Araucaria cunninghamii TaxID=56994 RepID=A0A0D6QVF5_ARACU
MECEAQNQVHEKAGPNPNTKHEMRRSWSQKSSQVAPLDMVPYDSDNSQVVVPVSTAEEPPPPSTQVRENIDAYSGAYRNLASLIIFILHILLALGGMGYLGFKGIQAALRKGSNRFHIEHWYPQLVAAAAVGAIFSCAWQWIVVTKPVVMIKGVLWTSPALSFMASLMLISTSYSASVGLGIILLLFSVAQALYACWVTSRIKYASKLLPKSLVAVTQFPGLHHPSYWVILMAFIWISFWILGVVGAISQKYAALSILALIVSLGWMMEVLRNIVHVTVARVVALFYLRGMQSNVHFSFHRALTTSLGSISLGSILVPVLEALRVLARALNLVEGEDEFLFSCAHCYLRVMEYIFQFGNNWAFVQVAVYGKGFVKAARDTWTMFDARGLEPVINQDLTSSMCFLSGIASGAVCVIVSGSWTFATHKNLTATVSFLSFLIGYFMMRITMAMPQACVCAHYVCYAENPENRAFDGTIADRAKDFQRSVV